MRIIRIFFRSPNEYLVKVDEAENIAEINWQDRGKYPRGYPADAYFANYGEKSGRLAILFQPMLRSLGEDLAWLKKHPRRAHREVFPRGEIIDEANDPKVVKVLENVTLLDMLETLKEFFPSKR